MDNLANTINNQGFCRGNGDAFPCEEDAIVLVSMGLAAAGLGFRPERAADDACRFHRGGIHPALAGVVFPALGQRDFRIARGKLTLVSRGPGC